MIPEDADFTNYKVIIAPVLYMVKSGLAEKLEDYVEKGGYLILTTMSGIVDQSDNVHLGGYPGPLRRLAGVWVEEIDALAPGQSNTLHFTNGESVPCEMICDLMHIEGAKAIASYDKDFYAGMPAITENSFGEGLVCYVGTVLQPTDMEVFLKDFLNDAGVCSLIPEKTELEISCRSGKDADLIFVINFVDEPKKLPVCLAGLKDIITGSTSSTDELIPKWGVKILKKER